MSRIAIIDLLFNWPPDGGARTDVKEIASRLSREHKVRMFIPDFLHYFPRGQIRSSLSLNIKKIPFDFTTFHPSQISSRFKQEVERYKPDFVFITDAWYLKPYLVNALRDYNPILRFYAYETLCLKSHGHFYTDGRLCNNDYLNGSLGCVLDCIGCSLRWLKHMTDRHFNHEFGISFTLFPSYRDLVKRAIKNASRIVVYNDFIRDKIVRFNQNVIIIPSGVDIKLFRPKKKHRRGKVKILMVGRIEDDLKGFSTLYEACQKLRKKGYNFQLLLTTNNKFNNEDYITSVGWLSQEGLAQLYQQIDICVVPSAWPEPFGIVALEAMASGKAVIVTRVGGLQTILKDGKEGFIINPKDADGLTSRLQQLMDNPQLRERMGQAGRKKTEEIYDWDVIYEKYYRPLFSRKNNLIVSKTRNEEIREDNFLKIPRRNDSSRRDLIRGISSGRYAYIGPRTVQIDITNRCNNNCLYCWARSPLLGRKRATKEWESRELPLDLTEKLIDDLHSLGTENIHIAGGGEPLIYPGIIDLIEHIKQKGMRCELTTNFTLITEDIIRRIVELNVDSVTVSLWSGTAKTYKKLHPNKTKATFYRIIKMLKLASAVKKRKNEPLPSFRLCNVISDINCHEIEEMIDLAEETQVESYFFQVIDPVSGYTDRLLLSDKERKELKYKLNSLKPRMEELALKRNIRVCELDEFIRRISSENASTGHYDEAEITKIPCYAGWVFSRITADGNVNFCLKTDEYPIGNIYKQSFKEIWYSEQYDDFRERMLKHLAMPNQPLRCNTTCDNRQENLNIRKLMEEYR